MARYLVTTIPQVDGGTRELYVYGARNARLARQQLRRDPASVEAIGPDEIVDVDASGRRTRRVI